MGSARITLPIFGLTCGGGGALTVERSLERTPGVLEVYVNPLTEMAYVQYDPATTGPRDLLAAIEAVGFRSSGPRDS